jgi:hypothetical protein
MNAENEKNMNIEIVSLNLADLEVTEIERRFEMVAVVLRGCNAQNGVVPLRGCNAQNG